MTKIMNNLRSHFISRQQQLEAISKSILRLTSNPNRNGDRDLASQVSSKRNELISTMSSLFFPSSGDEHDPDENSNTCVMLSSLFRDAVRESIESASQASSSLNFESDVRFLLNLWDSLDETVKKVIFDVKPALLFFDAHEKRDDKYGGNNSSVVNSNNKMMVLVVATTDYDAIMNNNEEENSHQISSISRIWYSIQQRVLSSLPRRTIEDEHSAIGGKLEMSTLFRVFVLDQLLLTILDESNTNNNETDKKVEDRNHQHEEPTTADEEADKDEQFTRTTLLALISSVALRRGQSQEISLILFERFIVLPSSSSENKTNITNPSFAFLFSSILETEKINSRNRTEVVSKFISFIANSSSESLSDPVKTSQRFARDVLEKLIILSSNRDDDDQDHGDHDDDDQPSWWFSTLFLEPLQKCLLNRVSCEFLILGVIPQLRGRHLYQKIIPFLFAQTCALWSHNDDDTEETKPSSSSKLLFSKPSHFTGSSSSFLHSSSSEATWSLVSTLMSLLQLSKFYMSHKSNNRNRINPMNSLDGEKDGKEAGETVDDEKSERKKFYSMMILESTNSVLRGISFRLSALNRLSQKQGALVASLYFAVSGMQLNIMNEETERLKKNAKKEPKKNIGKDDDDDDDENDNDDELTQSQQHQITAPKFDQFPNLLENYLEDERSIWSMLAEVSCCQTFSSSQQQQSIQDDEVLLNEEMTSLVRDMISRKHRVVSSGSSNKKDEKTKDKISNENINTLRGKSKYWFLPKYYSRQFSGNVGSSSSFLHPRVYSSIPSNRTAFLQKKFGVNASKLDTTVASTEERFKTEETKTQQAHLDRQRSSLITTNSNDNHQQLVNIEVQKEQEALRNAVSTLRELEIRLTHAETNSSNSTVASSNSGDHSTNSNNNNQNKSSTEIGEETMKELPLVLEKLFVKKHTVNKFHHQQQRSHVTDPTVVVRLFMLSVASSFSGIKGEVSFAASSAAAWCFALLPSQILDECRKILNGADFALIHKLRCYNAMQVGMARLANTRIVDTNENFVHGEENDNNIINSKTHPVVYPPFPGTKQPFMMEEEKKDTSSGTVRWKSIKLSNEYQERERMNKSAIYSNEAIPLARAAVETVLLLNAPVENGDNNNNSDNVSTADMMNETDKQNNNQNTRKPSNRQQFKLIRVDPEGGMILEALRSVTLIVEFVSRTSHLVMDYVAESSLECLFALASSHYLPSVRVNALVCLSAVLKFPETRRNVLFGGNDGRNAFNQLTTALFLSGIAKLAKEDPDSSVRFVASDLIEMLLA